MAIGPHYVGEKAARTFAAETFLFWRCILRCLLVSTSSRSAADSSPT